MSEEKREEARRVVVDLGSSGGGAEELKEVLDAVSEFLKNLSEPLERILDTILKAVEGGRLGAEVAAFYKKLVEAGVPSELAAEMTKEFFEKRMSLIDLSELVKKFVRKEVLEEEEEE